MKVQFEKYQGTGNDFVMLDNMTGVFDTLSIEQISKICDRRFGVGADGLIKINTHSNLDFEMDYYNSDGTKSFCGNGARCAVAFAKTLGIIEKETHFNAIDGDHQAQINDETVALNMKDVLSVNQSVGSYQLNTGSPHFVKFVEKLDQSDIYEFGKEIRFSNQYKKDGINVNLVEELHDNSIKIATYERGVEDETLSCGTGATACALVEAFKKDQTGENRIFVEVKGGNLLVEFTYLGNGSFRNIQLIGPAKFVFKGEINV